MARTYFVVRRLRDHDPSIEPIVVLGCGRTYALSTLDAYLGLSASYEKVREIVVILPLRETESNWMTLR